MKIDDTLKRAEFIKRVIADHGWKKECSPDKLIEASGEIIDEMMDIIDWYDRNQRRIIKSAIKISKENRKLKHILTYIINNFGGDINDAT